MQQNKSTNDVRTTDERLLALKDAHGPVLFNMTNDYLFRAVLQTNHNVLKGLVCSLLHLNEADIKSLKILNPIELGKQIDKKEFHLDVKLDLNNNSTSNNNKGSVANCDRALLSLSIPNTPTPHPQSAPHLPTPHPVRCRSQSYQHLKSRISS